MNTSTRGRLRQLGEATALRTHALAQRLDLARETGGARARVPSWLVLRATPRAYRGWQRAVSALVAATLFVGPITVTVEQSRDAAGVLAAGSHRIDDGTLRNRLAFAVPTVRLSLELGTLAHAAPIVDPNAPITFQPKITQSTGANGGVPVVNITAPNSAGISLNQYQSFNIDPVGLILNNSLMSGTSLTGGNVQANPNLSGRTASVIVNQVTSTGSAFASLLNGPLEVFGAPATVIIANPNGITTNGTGFTNTIGVSLSTGVPQFLSSVGGSVTSFDNAQAIGYNVTGGHIQVEGNSGVNGPGSGIEGTVGTIDLIGETIGINAPLYAGTRINVIAGRQFVTPSAVDSTGTTYSTAANGATNTASAINAANGNANNGLAIDATAYGAMTAGQIQVIGTAAGMGVRTDAQLAANTGNLLLSSNGDLTVAGSAAQQQATLQAAGNVSMTGTHIGVGGYAISANGDVTSTGSIQSGGNLTINAGGNIDVANTQSSADTTMTAGQNVTTGDVQSGGALALTAQGKDGTGDVTLNGTSVVVGNTSLQAARDVDVNGQTSGSTLQATAGRNVTVNAALQTSSDLALTATAGNLTTNANVNSDGNLALTSGQSTTIAAQATAQKAVTLSAGQDLAIAGSLASGTTLDASATNAFSVAGSLLVGTNGTIAAGSIDVPGVLIVQQNGTLNAQGDLTGSGSIAFGQSGTLASGQDVALTGKLLANGLQVSAANSVTLAAVQAGGAFSAVANGLDGGGDVTFNGDAAVVGATSVQAARDVLVNGTLAGGAQVTVAAQRNVTVATGGTVQSVGDLSVTATNGSVTSAGTLGSGGKLTAQAAQDVALTGATSATSDTTLTAGHDLTIGGTFAGQGAGTLSAGHDATLGGSSGFAQDATVTAGNNVNVTGALQGNNVTLTAGNAATLNNVQANAALAVTANGTGTGTGSGNIGIDGSVTSQTGSTLNAAGGVSVASSGTLGTSAAMNVTAAGDIAVAGSIVSNGSTTLTSTGGSLTSTGSIASGTDLNVSANQSIDLEANGSGGGSTQALGNLVLNAGQNITANGTVVSQGNGTLQAGGAIAGSGALAFGLAASLMSGSDTTLTGSLRGATITTQAGGSGTFQDVSAGSTIALNATGGDVTLNGTLAGGATVLLNAGQNVNVNGTLQSASDTTLAALGGNVNVTGALNSNGALNVTSGTDIDLGGTTTVALDTTLQGGRDINVTGSVSGQGNGFVSAARNIGGAGSLGFTQAATLSAGGSIAQGGLVQGQTVQITAAGDVAVNNVESASTIALTSGTGGSGNLTVNGAAAGAGAITANANGSVTVVPTGKLAAGTTANVTALTDLNVAGAIEANGDTTLTAQQGSLNATGGINSGGVLNITTGLDLSLGASTSAVGDVTLNAGRDAILNGTLVGGGNGSVTAGRDITGPGTQAFTNAATLTAQRDIALTGSLSANSVTATGGDSAALNDVASLTTLALTANGNAGNGDASITGTATAPGAVTLTAARDVLVSGTLGSGDALTLSAQRNVSVTSTGTVQSVGNLNVTATTGNAALNGTATTQGTLSVTSGGDTTLGGQISSTGNLTAQAGGDIQLTGTVAGQGSGSLTAAHDITGAGSAAFAQAATLSASNDLALTGSLQGSSVSVTGGNNAGLGSAQATTGDLTVLANGNAGEGDVTFVGAASAFGNMSLQAARNVGVGGAINSGGTTAIGATGSLTTADLHSAGDVSLTAQSGAVSVGNLTTNGNLNATAGTDVSAASAQVAGTVALTANGTGAAGTGNVNVTGALASGGATTVSAALDATLGGDVTSGGALTATAARSLSVGGNISTNGDTSLTATSGNLAVSGTTTTPGNLVANAGGALSLAGGLVNGTSKLTSTGNMTLTGTLLGLGAATLTAGGSIGGGGALTIGQDITIDAGTTVTLGGIQGAGQLLATSGGDMSFGATTAVGNVSATSTGGSVTFNGALQSGGNVQIQAANSASVTGATSSMGNVNVTGTHGNVSVAGVSSNGDTTLTAGQSLTLSGTSTVAGQFAVSGGNVTISGSQGGSKNVTVSATGTLDAGSASLVSTQNMSLSGANVTVGDAIVGGALTASATNQLSLVGSAVDVVGAATLTSQNGFYNASSVLSGGNLTVTAPNMTNAANASLASTATTTINASSFTNSGLVNGATTNVTVSGGLTNVGGSLMGVNALNVNVGSLNNQNGLLFAGDVNGSGVGNLSLRINGGNGAFSNGGGELLAIQNASLSAVNMSFDGSTQGTISAGNTLSLTVGSMSLSSNWNLTAGNVAIEALNGFSNSGVLNSTGSLTISSNGAINNNGQVVSGGTLALNGAVSNGSGAVINAASALNLSGSVMNRGTVESSGNLTFSGGGNYDNQYGTTQAGGTITLNTGGTIYNSAGSITAAGNVNINAGAVINDAFQAASQTQTQLVGASADSSLVTGIVIGTLTSAGCSGSTHGDCIYYTDTTNATVNTLEPNLSSNDIQVEIGAYNPCYGSSDCQNIEVGNTSGGGQIETIALPGIDRTTTTPGALSPGVISAGGSVNITTGLLSNAGSTISAGLDVNLNLQSLNNAPLGNSTETVVDVVDQGQLNAFMAQLNALGTIGIYGTDGAGISGTVIPESYVTVNPSASAPPAATSTVTSFGTQGQIIAGRNMTISGGNIVNGGLLYAGNDFNASGTQSFSNQGQYNSTTSTQPGCATGVSGTECSNSIGYRGNSPNTTTFSYAEQSATVYAGHDLVIAAGQISNTDGSLIAGHDIVIGGVGTTATSTTPAQSLTNTSGNIIAGNNITLDVSGAITNTLPSPVTVHQNYGTDEAYSGCMTAGGYKESFCEAYVDQQSGSSSIISAGNGLQINAGSLTNIGSLISAGTSATINVTGPVVNEAQALNAYWHSEWVQETGDFSSDVRHNIWACGSAAQCTELYGSAYTNVGGTIDPPTPVGNIAATIQAPNLSISSGGQILNVGNVLGTSVTLTGRSLINGITTANTYTPRVNAPSQVISLSPLSLPGLTLSVPGSIGSAAAAQTVAGQASYVEGSLIGSQSTVLGPQQLLSALPSSLQPSSTLFYYSPQAEDIALQQAALQQTGQSSFVNGLSYDSTNGLSVTDQEKAILYSNALTYAEQNNLQLGTALTQTQINALTQPMLWYVEQTVPDPTCQSTGVVTCPTITALMPQVYLPQNTSALSAGGNIVGQNVTLNFNQDSSGSVLNTGNITASSTLTVNTNTLTNQANQVNVGQLWQYLNETGYEDTTGTEVQPGGFMSAENMNLNVQTLQQIGGALQQLGSDASVDQAGTQQLLASLQQQLGSDFTQTSVSDDLHSSFTAQGGFGAAQIVGLAFAVVVAVMTAGAASEAIGLAAGAEGGTFAGATAATTTAEGVAMPAISAGLGNVVLSAAAAGFTSSIASQLTMTGSLNWASAFEGAATAAITAGLTNGITYNNTTGLDFTTLPVMADQGTSTLASLAGVNPGIGTTVDQATASTASTLETRALAMLGEAGIDAGVQTAVEGGSFADALKNSLVQEGSAAGAYEIGDAQQTLSNDLGSVGGELAYVGLHGALGCAASAALGTGCAGGAIGGAASALISPYLVDQAGGAANLTDADRAAITAIAMLSGGTAAGLLGQNAMAGETAAENEATNNSEQVHDTALKPFGGLVSKVCGPPNPPCSDQMIQTLVTAQAANADQALGNMSTAAPVVGGALVGTLIGPEIVAACAANAVLCVNEVSILAGEVYAGLNGMPVGTGASAYAGVSSAADSAAALRVSNGVALNPALPDPLAGLGYKPTILNSSNANIANSQLNGYVAELNLANQVAVLPGQTVVAYGDAVGTHGADVVSVDSSGNVTLWDSKFRSSNQVVQSSPTFTPSSNALDNAINQAVGAIEDSNLPQSTINRALQNLQDGNFTTNTVGSGGAKNSMQIRFCGGKPC